MAGVALTPGKAWWLGGRDEPGDESIEPQSHPVSLTAFNINTATQCFLLTTLRADSLAVGPKIHTQSRSDYNPILLTEMGCEKKVPKKAY